MPHPRAVRLASSRRTSALGQAENKGVSVDVPELTRGVNNRDDLDDLVPKSINDAIISHHNLTQFWEASFLHGRPGPRKAAESTDGLPEAVDRAPSVNARVNARVPSDECVNRP
jgi:hypothetical protein